MGLDDAEECETPLHTLSEDDYDPQPHEAAQALAQKNVEEFDRQWKILKKMHVDEKFRDDVVGEYRRILSTAST